MKPTMFACLHRKVSDVKVVEEAQATKAVYRDELTKKQAPSKEVKKSVRFANSEPTILGELEKERSEIGKRISSEREGIRVKVKMTKEEAARLLSKCREGGVLEFKDVARELVSIPANRVRVEPTCTNKDPTLFVIPPLF